MLHQNKITLNDAEFLAMLAHDMKTPVKAQVTALKLLYSGAFGILSKEASNTILNILASNKYLQLLLDNILGDYRINKSKIVLNKTKNDIRKTIEESIKNIGILFETKEQKVEVNYLTEDFIKLYDEIEIQRVIINLLSNAFEYSKENSTINISVKTKGINLSVEVKSKIKFDKTPYKTGTGLGLKICEKIIFAHNGSFCKEKSEEGDFLTAFELP